MATVDAAGRPRERDVRCYGRCCMRCGTAFAARRDERLCPDCDHDHDRAAVRRDLGND